nr:hypothetical protein OG999_22785 [Streptomyces sp. NBC_00886]
MKKHLWAFVAVAVVAEADDDFATFEMREVGVDEREFVLVGVDGPDTARPIVEKAYGEPNRRYIQVDYAVEAEAATG